MCVHSIHMQASYYAQNGSCKQSKKDKQLLHQISPLQLPHTIFTMRDGISMLEPSWRPLQLFFLM